MWTLVHPIVIRARDDFAAVDCINEIQRLRFNHAFGDSWSDRWLHKENPMKIGRAIIVESSDHGPSFS